MNTLENTLQIESKLEKETKAITHLKGRVEKYHDLAKSMSSILNSFEQRLGKLEQTIVPVYKETEHLQKKQQNLDATLQCLDVVLSHYDASQDVCNLIHMGPSSEGNINVFLDALNKLQKAKDYFFANNSQSVELENVTSLFNTGCETLCNHFKLLLKKHSIPLRPVELLDLIYTEDDSSNEDCPSIKQLPPSTRDELNTIAAWLDNNLYFHYKNIFADERSDVIYKSLSMLKDHQKSGSWGTEQLKSSRYYSRGDGNPKKTTSARLQQIFERKANKMFLKASQTLEQSTGISIKKNSSYGDNLSAEEYMVDGDQELDKYLVLLLGLQRLLIWERQLLRDVIPASKQSEVFSRLAQNSIDMIVTDAEMITNKIIRNIARKEWSSALGVFSALKHVILLQPDIDKAFDKNQRNQFSLILQRLQQTGLKALEQFIELVKGDTGTNLVGTSTLTSYTTSNVPKDATVHELTSNAIWFIEHLYEHSDVIGPILMTDANYVNQLDIAFSNKTMSSDLKNKASLGIYIKKILSELNLTIVSKCEQYNDVATRHLFRLNNVHHILKSLQQSNLLELVAITESNIEKNYQDSIQDIKIAYQKSWSRILSYISPLDDLPRPINGKIKDKERNTIKERFANFNKEFEEACKIQKGISVPDVILREGLKRDNAEHIIPLYYAFYDSYSDVQFSKNPDKYVKYKIEDVTSMLNNLFDDTFYNPLKSRK